MFEAIYVKLLRFFYLASFQAVLTECVEAGQHFGRHKGAIADWTFCVGAGETATTKGRG